MGVRSVRRRWRVAGLGGLGLVALSACNLGVAPVTYELVDAEDANWPLGPTGLASGDVDGDGDVDVVATGRDGYAVLTNDGSGTFSLDFGESYAEQRAPSLVDLDGDGDLDLLSIVTWPELGAVPVVNRNQGAGSFALAEPASSPHPAGLLATAVPSDADGDGDVDLLAGFRVGHERHVGTYLNDGTGAFAVPATDPVPLTSDTLTSMRLVAGDLDNDGDDDLVVTDEEPWGDGFDEGTLAAVALNDGTGAFTAAGGAVDVGGGSLGWTLTPNLTDLDDDGNLDLVVGGTSAVTTLQGDGAGGFAAPRAWGVPDARGVDFVSPADIDGDGKVDLVAFKDVLDATSGAVFYGDGAGGLDSMHTLDTGTDAGNGTPARDIEITDLEGDGDPDILFLAEHLGVVENAIEGRPAH